jgi:hypothetical protein
MIILDLHPELAARAQARLDKEGWRDLEQILTQLLTKYAYYRDAAGGGHARAKSMTPSQRSKAASRAATARWAGKTEAERLAYSQKMIEARTLPAREAERLVAKLLVGGRRVPGWPLMDDDGEEG